MILNVHYSLVQMTACAMAGLSVLVGITVTPRWLLSFWQERRRLSFQRPRWHLDFVVACILSIWITVLSPIRLLEQVTVIRFFHSAIILDLIPAMICYQTTATLFTAQVWLWFFDINWTIFRTNSEWIHCLDPNTPCFFDTYRSTLGNTWFITRLISIKFLLVLVPFCVVSLFFSHFIVELCFAGTLALIFLVCFWIWRHVPPFDDVGSIRTQYKAIMILGCLVSLAFVSRTILEMWFLSPAWSLVWFYVPFTVLQLAIVWFSVVFPFRQPLDESRSISLSTPDQPEKPEDASLSQKLNKIAENEQSYASFMRHLGREYAMESLLFLTEYSQFKLLIAEKYSQPIEDGILQLRTEYAFPVLPARVRGTSNLIKTSDSLHDKADALYAKYIRFGAELEVNVSSDIRSALADVFDISVMRTLSAKARPSFSQQESALAILVGSSRLAPKDSRDLDLDRVDDDTLSKDNEVAAIMNIFDDAAKEVRELLYGCLTRYLVIKAKKAAQRKSDSTSM